MVVTHYPTKHTSSIWNLATTILLTIILTTPHIFITTGHVPQFLGRYIVCFHYIHLRSPLLNHVIENLFFMRNLESRVLDIWFFFYVKPNFKARNDGP